MTPTMAQLHDIFVLIACEESQCECMAFRALGYSAFSCDLQPCSGGHPEWHIIGDCSGILDGRCSFTTEDGAQHVVSDRWHLVIGHPPCTYLCKASSAFMFDSPGCINPERFALAMEAKELFLRILNCDCEHVAVENPTPLKCVGLPGYSCVVQPYEFGHRFSKRTCLWLRNLPPLLPMLWADTYRSYVYSTRGGKKRSKSFAGIARAMAIQWGSLLR